MSNGSTRDNATRDDATGALPRRGADRTGRIPTRYGPGNPVSDRLKRHQFRFRPGALDAMNAPDAPAPDPAQARPTGSTKQTYAVRPGTPADATHELFQGLADKKQAEDRRRGRLWLAVAVVALIGLVGAVVALTTGQPAKPAAAPAPPTVAATTPSPTATPSATATTAPPSAPATVDPAAVISDARTDTAPLGAVTLFPGKSVTVQGHSYTQALTTQSDCGAAATAPLNGTLVRNGCRTVFRATYVTGTTAVTVGIAVFDNAAQAAAVKQQATSGNLEPLSGGPLPAFCHAVACRLTVNSFGRYAYFTVAGYTTGKPVLPADTSALAAGADLGTMAFENLATRARAEAATAGPGAH